MYVCMYTYICVYIYTRSMYAWTHTYICGVYMNIDLDLQQNTPPYGDFLIPSWDGKMAYSDYYKGFKGNSAASTMWMRSPCPTTPKPQALIPSTLTQGFYIVSPTNYASFPQMLQSSLCGDNGNSLVFQNQCVLAYFNKGPN